LARVSEEIAARDERELERTVNNNGLGSLLYFVGEI